MIIHCLKFFASILSAPDFAFAKRTSWSCLCNCSSCPRSSQLTNCWRYGQSSRAGTVGWARTTDLLFHSLEDWHSWTFPGIT